MEPMWHPSWEPFWQGVDEVQLPLHFHTFPTTPPRARQEALQHRRAAMLTGVSAFQTGPIHIIAGMMGGRVRVLSWPARVVWREPPGGSPMRCTAWISNMRTASAT
jgi:hypothetical protein